ncbi:hypothetical protein HID58_061725, partial [Brassica napus]
SYIPKFLLQYLVLFRSLYFAKWRTRVSHVSSISFFLSCLFVSSFFVNILVSLPFSRPDQIEILMAFKNEFPILKCHFKKFPSSRQKTKSWTSKDIRFFDGVVFDNETGVVTKLDLHGACLSGSLSANSSLFRFHHLRYLDLSHNYFDSFSFLPELGKLTNLDVLDLSNMGLAGEIPSSVSTLNGLKDLFLSDNELIGSFSPVYNLTRLSSFNLSSNLFSGNVPCSLLTMPFLSTLDLSQNHLIDSLDSMNCSSSSNLETLYLSHNRLSGRALEPLSKLSNLKQLYLSFQNTTDPFNVVSLGFKSLEILYLSGTAISRLDTGSPNLKELYLDNCSINEFPTFIKSLRKLRYLEILNNRLKGEVPKWLWDMPSLNALLIHNQITGKLPRSLINCTHLEYLNVEGNRIADTYPFWLKELPKLQVIVLRSNMFHGPIYSPHHPLSFSQLRIVDISCNKFTGRLPQDYFVNWSKLLLGIHQEERESMYMGNNYHYGTQIGGQPRSSFEGNLNLCGLPLKSCFGDKIPSTPEAEEPRPQKQEQVLNWKAAAMGYGPGILFGLAIGQILYSYKPVLFYKLFRI